MRGPAENGCSTLSIDTGESQRNEKGAKRPIRWLPQPASPASWRATDCQSGELPCLRRGICSRLFSSISSAEAISRRVSAGSITMST